MHGTGRVTCLRASTTESSRSQKTTHKPLLAFFINDASIVTKETHTLPFLFGEVRLTYIGRADFK